jgi:flavin reductase (DIM6/NTAB) family NADH-FMN oxidoreductase RutF
VSETSSPNFLYFGGGLAYGRLLQICRSLISLQALCQGYCDELEFVWNMATYDQGLDVNTSVLETWDDEFEIANIKKSPSNQVLPPHVANNPVAFECRVFTIVRIPNEHHGNGMFGPHLVDTSDIVIGSVLGIPIIENTLLVNV